MIERCETCGISREHDGAGYRKALEAAGKPMCPDSFHDSPSVDFYEWAEGEWHEPIHDGYLMACCDCGLVHRVDFAVRDGEQVQMRVFRDDELTERERKERGITVEH